MPKKTFFNLPADKRQRIIDQAILEFGEHPFEQASLSAIVARCGISKGSIYQYFDNKLDLFHWLLFEHVGQEKLRFMREHLPYDPAAPLFDNLEQQLHAGLSWGMQRPQLSRLGMRLWEPTSHPEVRAMQEEGRQVGLRWMKMMVNAAQDGGELRADLDLDLAAGLLMMVLQRAFMDLLPARLGLPLDQWLAGAEPAEPFGQAEQAEFVHQLMLFLRLGLTGLSPR